MLLLRIPFPFQLKSQPPDLSLCQHHVLGHLQNRLSRFWYCGGENSCLNNFLIFFFFDFFYSFTHLKCVFVETVF